jgi:predicted DNA-binding antitoxin AbrB/MazE fold protein
MVNLNKVARNVTLKEGLKKSISIAQVKEVIKHLLNELSKKKNEEVEKLLEKYRNAKKSK